MMSIRRYLFRTLALTLTLVTILSVIAAWLISQNELEEILDAQLAITGRGLMSMLPAEPEAEDYERLAQWMDQRKASTRLYAESGAVRSLDQADGQTFHHEERKVGFGLWNDAGKPLLIGPGWHDAKTQMTAPVEQGFRWRSLEASRWRVFALHDDSRGLWLQIGIEREFFSDIIERIALNQLWPMVLLMPLCLLLVLRHIRRGLTPIRRLSEQVEHRDSGDLGEILLDVPDELKGLRGALNDFLKRLKAALEKERRFTADAAHELRTPLAAMKIHLDNAIAGESNALPKARQGVERLQRVVEQLLVLARVDRHSSAAREQVDLRALLQDLAAELWPLAQARNQIIELVDLPHVFVAGNATEIGIMVRNLMDNALRYSPDNSTVHVTLESASSGPILCILDSGPGIAESHLNRVSERFHRASDSSVTGSGLGLSIVTAMARQQGVSLSLSNRSQGGLCARLAWS
ncbi:MULTISPECIES: ATP-binding protein [Halomonas]|uniref:ATP-binding protein n=1 Tax=Halomonas TaxID=2745 RepID=UPI001A8F2A75|nr:MULTISPECIES: ATP-binding protein [Halomonas]MBN8412988.1 HAMP domain-containing protein [Halomonas litopenaei]MBY5968211.1 HAMP domain-containing protein [Halomonas denitrificans]